MVMAGAASARLRSEAIVPAARLVARSVRVGTAVEPVAGAANGEEVAWMVGIGLEQLAQP